MWKKYCGIVPVVLIIIMCLESCTGKSSYGTNYVAAVSNDDFDART